MKKLMAVLALSSIGAPVMAAEATQSALIDYCREIVLSKNPLHQSKLALDSVEVQKSSHLLKLGVRKLKNLYSPKDADLYVCSFRLLEYEKVDTTGFVYLYTYSTTWGVSSNPTAKVKTNPNTKQDFYVEVLNAKAESDYVKVLNLDYKSN